MAKDKRPLHLGGEVQNKPAQPGPRSLLAFFHLSTTATVITYHLHDFPFLILSV